MTDIRRKTKIDKISNLVSEIMFELGIEPTESNRLTPDRVARMYVDEVFSSLSTPESELIDQMTLFGVEDGAVPVTVTVPFYSMCEHHLMPFMGTVTVEYLPKNDIIGLSKIPRAVDYFSRKPQLQERLTQEIGEFLWNIIKPVSMKVTITANHTCVSMRGVRKPGETTTEWERKFNEEETCKDGDK